VIPARADELTVEETVDLKNGKKRLMEIVWFCTAADVRVEENTDWRYRAHLPLL
jgi:hypothetical protein